MGKLICQNSSSYGTRFHREMVTDPKVRRLEKSYLRKKKIRKGLQRVCQALEKEKIK